MDDDELFAPAAPAPPPPPPPPAGGNVDGEIPTVFASSAEWVRDWLMVWAMPPEFWCSQWTDHRPAASRIHALWQAWEVANLEGGAAMSSWWLHHYDGHIAALSSTKGPFARCKSAHVESDPWRKR